MLLCDRKSENRPVSEKNKIALLPLTSSEDVVIQFEVNPTLNLRVKCVISVLVLERLLLHARDN